MKDIETEIQNTSLDDERRVRVLSPSMLVMKRFARNKLAVLGFIILAAMFVFTFLGGFIMTNVVGYRENTVFNTTNVMEKPYASAKHNDELRFHVFEGREFGSIQISSFYGAITANREYFSSRGINYSMQKEGENFYSIFVLNPAAAIETTRRGLETVTPADIDSRLLSAAKQARSENNSIFEYSGVKYTIAGTNDNWQFGTVTPTAFSSFYVIDTAAAGVTVPSELQFAAEIAMYNGGSSFEYDGNVWGLKPGEGSAEIYAPDGSHFGNLTTFIVQAIMPDVFLSIGFKNLLMDVMSQKTEIFSFPDETGESINYFVEYTPTTTNVRSRQETGVIANYQKPSLKHISGTDGNGMDLLTRLMYGGRISMTIGFVVVAIELLIGIILGGMSGYFGGWVDNLLMRLVDVFNCIPFMPIVLIIGSVFDKLAIEPRMRIFYMMLVLGFLGWPAVARTVRGQILSLREQEFMIAAEATGISTARRIFRHLIPNVIPQLIVIATMGLGSVILTESVLSFLGLGVKHPYASWGNIITAVNNQHVLVTYPFVWIPAGMLILITVLGFNFVGDGLRDAFDPKMKR